MQERDRMMIERYLAQEMTATERIEVEQRIENDTEFRNEFDEYKIVMDALKLAQREELKNRFRERDKILDRKNIRHPGRGRSLWMLAAIVTGVIALSWLVYYGYRQPAQEEIITVKDSTIIQEQIPVIDSTGLPEREEKVPDMADNKEKPKRVPKDRGKELFAANFEPYVDESMDIAVRGDELAQDKFLDSYIRGNYEIAKERFEQMEELLKSNDNLRFLYANALMAENLGDEAIELLSEIQRNGKSNYQAEINYYLGLAYLSKGNTIYAKRHLEAYIKIDGFQKEKAKNILIQLN